MHVASCPCSSRGLLPLLTLPAPRCPGLIRPAYPACYSTPPLPSAAFPRVRLDNLQNYPECFLGADSSSPPGPTRSDVCGWGLGSVRLTSFPVMLVPAGVWGPVSTVAQVLNSSLSTGPLYLASFPSPHPTVATSRCPQPPHHLRSLLHLEGFAVRVAQMRAGDPPPWPPPPVLCSSLCFGHY